MPIDAHRLKVIVETCGVGINKFKAQKDSLTAGFRQKVEDIVHGKDMGKVEIILCERDLPNMVGFHELYSHIKEPYSFIVGQSMKGVGDHKKFNLCLTYLYLVQQAVVSRYSSARPCFHC